MMDITVFNPSTEQDSIGQTMRLSQLVSLLRRHVLLIVICAVWGALAAYVYAKSLPRSYSAAATIAIEGQTYAIPELQGAVRAESMSDPMPLVRTEVQALLSRQLIQAVIDELGLDRLPEFNPALRPPSAGEKIRAYVQQLLPARFAPRSALPASEPASEQAVQNEVLRSLVVSQDNRSLVIGIDFTAHDPNLAAAFVDGLIEQYLTWRVQRRNESNKNANDEIEQRVDAVRVRLRELEAQMRDLRTSNELVGLRAGSIGQQQLEELATAAAKASLERAQIEAQWQKANALVRQGASANLSDVLNSPTIGKLREQESEASRRLADLSSTFGPDYPGISRAQAALQDARSQVQQETRRIIASLSTQLNLAKTRESDTQHQLQVARDQGVKVENAQADLNALQQEMIAQRSLYQSLLQGAQRTIAQSVAAESGLNVRVLSRAVPSFDPSSPNMKLATGLGGLGGCVLGLLLAFVRGNPTDRLVTAGDICTSAGLPVLATLQGARRGKTLLERTLDEPGGPEAEALRLMRTQLRAGKRFGMARSVVFTAMHDDLDAANIAAAFAYLAARDGERVALVEGNLAGPRLASLLQIKHASYLPVLEGNADWRDALLSDEQAKIDFLLEVNPAAARGKLLGGPRFQNLLMDLHRDYDLTVLSGPLESLASAVAGETDAAVLVCRVETTEPRALHAAARRLAAAARGRAAAVLTMASGKG